MFKPLSAFLGIALVLWCTPARAAVLAQWNPSGDVNEANFPATSTAAVTASSLTYAGTNLLNVPITGDYGVKNWPIAFDPTYYIQFSVTGTITFTSVDFSWWSSSWHVNAMQLRSSVDGYGAALATATNAQGSTGGVKNTSLNVSSLGQRTGTTTFRMYFYGSSAVTPAAYFEGSAVSASSYGLRVVGAVPPCTANQSVTNHACVACAAGSTRAAGDDPAGANTTCAPTLCAVDLHVVNHACVACAAGSGRPAGDNATGADTSCADPLRARLPRREPRLRGLRRGHHPPRRGQRDGKRHDLHRDPLCGEPVRLQPRLRGLRAGQHPPRRRQRDRRQHQLHGDDLLRQSVRLQPHLRGLRARKHQPGR